MNINELKKVYEDLPDEKLLRLYKEKQGLSQEALPVLVEELKRRNLLAQAEARDPGEREPYHFSSEEELESFVKIRLLEGESLESIHLDLLEQGINIKQKFHDRLSLEREVIDFHLQQTVEHGRTEAEVRQELADRLGIQEDDIEEIKDKHRASGNSYQVVGIGLLAAGGLLILFAIMGESLDAFFTGLGICGSGYLATKKHEALQR